MQHVLFMLNLDSRCIHMVSTTVISVAKHHFLLLACIAPGMGEIMRDHAHNK